MSFTLIESTPYRSPLIVWDTLSKYLKNKKVFDLGCGSGDVMLYIREKLDPISIKGVDYNPSRPEYQKNKYKLDIQNKFILDVDFEAEDIDTYYLWIEKPLIEIEVVKKLINKECTVIILYNLPGKISCSCDICSYLLRIPQKLLNLKKMFKEHSISYSEQTIIFNEGNGCRQNGEFLCFLINNLEPQGKIQQ